MRILFDYWYDNNYLQAFGFVLVTKNNGTFKSLFVCTKANSEVVWEQLRRTMQIKAFRLNKYEDCGKVLKYFDAFEGNWATVLTIRTLIKNFNFN